MSILNIVHPEAVFRAHASTRPSATRPLDHSPTRPQLSYPLSTMYGPDPAPPNRGGGLGFFLVALHPGDTQIGVLLGARMPKRKSSSRDEGDVLPRLDLHHHTLREAREEVKTFIARYAKSHPGQTVLVDTGIGIHSRGAPVLAPAIERMLRAGLPGIRTVDVDPTTCAFLVTLKGNPATGNGRSSATSASRRNGANAKVGDEFVCAICHKRCIVVDEPGLGLTERVLPQAKVVHLCNRRFAPSRFGDDSEDVGTNRQQGEEAPPTRPIQAAASVPRAEIRKLDEPPPPLASAEPSGYRGAPQGSQSRDIVKSCRTCKQLIRLVYNEEAERWIALSPDRRSLHQCIPPQAPEPVDCPECGARVLRVDRRDGSGSHLEEIDERAKHQCAVRPRRIVRRGHEPESGTHIGWEGDGPGIPAVPAKGRMPAYRPGPPSDRECPRCGGLLAGDGECVHCGT